LLISRRGKGTRLAYLDEKAAFDQIFVKGLRIFSTKTLEGNFKYFFNLNFTRLFRVKERPTCKTPTLNSIAMQITP
jgi:hypothetical protein